MIVRKLLAFGLVATAIAFQPAPSHAASNLVVNNLVVNGDFENLTNGDAEIVPGQTTGSGITSANNWYSYSTSANGGYPFLFFATNAVTTGFGDAWDNGQRYLWGAANGGAIAQDGSGTAWNGTSATGGHYLVMDGDYHATPISQNIAGLVAGTDYALSFSWAAAQWYGNTGATTETLYAALGNQYQATQTYNLASTSFSGWMPTTMTFRYNGGSNVLSFLAAGTPAGFPPMVLLDHVSLSAVPEPGSMLAYGAGVVLLAVMGLRRIRRRPTLA